jgi:hypothetical protein
MKTVDILAAHPLPQKQPVEPDLPDDSGLPVPPSRDRQAPDRRSGGVDDEGKDVPPEPADNVGGGLRRRPH